MSRVRWLRFNINTDHNVQLHSWSWKYCTQLTMIENWPKHVNRHFMKSLLCAIFIAIASESCTGNWILFNAKGTLVLLVFNLVQEMSNIEPLWLPLFNAASILFSWSSRTFMRILLDNPWEIYDCVVALTLLKRNWSRLIVWEDFFVFFQHG